MIRKITIALAATATLALAACGSDSDEPSVAPGTAKAQVERAAHITLAEDAVPADAREDGMRASFSNSATAADDKQAVALFVMKDAEVADEVSDRLRTSGPKSARLIVNGPVMVMYAPAGNDRSEAVQRAVDAL
jgi:CTP:molybdopterin cytidylyltransferase MocA